jgi:cytochrome c oxidase subunit 1
MFGRQMHDGLAKAHFWTSVVLITLVFSGQLLVGYAGQQRRLFNPYEYTVLQHLLPLNKWTSYAGWALGLSQFLFVVNWFWSVFAGKKATQNPWEVGTLEWTLPSPPVHHNFDVVPTVVRGPHEYGNPDVKKALGRDWIGQAEEMPAITGAGAKGGGGEAAAARAKE